MLAYKNIEGQSGVDKDELIHGAMWNKSSKCEI